MGARVIRTNYAATMDSTSCNSGLSFRISRAGSAVIRHCRQPPENVFDDLMNLFGGHAKPVMARMIESGTNWNLLWRTSTGTSTGASRSARTILAFQHADN